MHAPMTTIDLPSALTSIGQSAFGSCSKLETLNLPNLKSIAKEGFQYCQMIKRLILPEGFTTLREQAFKYCVKIEYVLIPSTIERIDSEVFRYCTGLKAAIILGKPRTYFSNLTFNGCSNLLDVYVAWNYGEESHAPWGATNAAIHYASEGWMDDLEEIMAEWEV